jgi:triacylglycerol lipase
MEHLHTVLEFFSPPRAPPPCPRNDHPIILVHGFGGWGRTEGLLLTYWGCIQGDIQEHLKAQDYTVYTAKVGPFSSNWDRACELYAQIKGGQVDYGATHSSAHGHARFGRTFPGLYPQWGEVGADGKVKKIHLIGHSMGGQTIRMLAQLLAKGSNGAPEEEAPSSHPLFMGGKEDWVHSITTISTPNQGTLLADGFAEIGNTVKNTMMGVFSMFGFAGAMADAYHDVQLDQWGIQSRQPDESFTDYWGRIWNSNIFKPGFRDVALWSLSTPGATDENMWVETLPSIYYFSFANVDTKPQCDEWLRETHTPNALTMLLPLQPLGAFLGGPFGQKLGFSTAWQANDGVVPTISMSTDAIGESVPFHGVAHRGKWNQMPMLDPLDHMAVIGLTLHTSILPLYELHARILRDLPNDTERDGDIYRSPPAMPPHDVAAALASITSSSERFESTAGVATQYALTIHQVALTYCKTALKARRERERKRSQSESNATSLN